MLKIVVLLNVLWKLWYILFFPGFKDEYKVQKNSILFEMENLLYIMNYCAVTFDQFNLSFAYLKVLIQINLLFNGSVYFHAFV